MLFCSLAAKITLPLCFHPIYWAVLRDQCNNTEWKSFHSVARVWCRLANWLRINSYYSRPGLDHEGNPFVLCSQGHPVMFEMTEMSVMENAFRTC